MTTTVKTAGSKGGKNAWKDIPEAERSRILKKRWAKGKKKKVDLPDLGPAPFDGRKEGNGPWNG